MPIRENIESDASSRWHKWEEWKGSIEHDGAGLFAIGRFPNLLSIADLNFSKEEIIYIGRTDHVADTLEKALFAFQYKVLHRSYDKAYKHFDDANIRQELSMLYAITQPVVSQDIRHRDVILDFLEARAKVKYLKLFGTLPLLNEH